MLALLILFSINGHLMIPQPRPEFLRASVGGISLGGNVVQQPMQGVILPRDCFSALPVVCAMLITNIAWACSVHEQQLQSLRRWIPLNVDWGFVVLILSLGYLATPITQVFEHRIAGHAGALHRRAALTRWHDGIALDRV